MKLKLFMLLAAMMLGSVSAFAQSGNYIEPARGDVNGDGVVDAADIASVIYLMKEGGGAVTLGRYFYFGTSQPTAENYRTLPGIIDTYSTIAEAVGASATVTFGDTLYMLCPTFWMNGEKVAIELNSGNTIIFFDEGDNQTVSGHTIYRTHAVNSSSTATLITNGVCNNGDEVDEIYNEFPFPETFLPAKVYGVIGETMQLFCRGIVRAINPYRCYNDFKCAQGKIYERYLEITPALVNGTIPTDLTIKHKLIDDQFNESDEITSSLVLTDRPSASPSSNLNVLCIGASTTSGGQWPSELKRRLTGTRDTGTPAADGLTNITFVGRKALAAASGKRPVDVKVEATGGWRWYTFYTPQDALRFLVSGVTSVDIGTNYTYLNENGDTVVITVAEVNITGDSGNIRFTYNPNYSVRGVPAAASGTLTKKGSSSGDTSIAYSSYEAETYCPFYDEQNGVPDFANYADTYCNGQIDVAIFYMGSVNEGIVGNSDLTKVLKRMKTLLDALHTDFPNCKVIIGCGSGFSTKYGLEYNYNANSRLKSWPYEYGQFRYVKAVEEFIKGDGYKDWCYLADTKAEVDSENVFPTSEKTVNTRMSETEVIGTNGAHPTLAGYRMIADCFYRCFVNVVLH